MPVEGLAPISPPLPYRSGSTTPPPHPHRDKNSADAAKRDAILLFIFSSSFHFILRRSVYFLFKGKGDWIFSIELSGFAFPIRRNIRQPVKPVSLSLSALFFLIFTFFSTSYHTFPDYSI